MFSTVIQTHSNCKQTNDDKWSMLFNSCITDQRCMEKLLLVDFPEEKGKSADRANASFLFRYR